MEVVDALFYNFAPDEVARHIPKVWRTTTPEAAIAARQMGCVKALRRILGDRVDAAAFARAAELLIKAATSAPLEGRPMYAALRAIPVPGDAVGHLFHAASLLREHRGDGHIAALMTEGVGGLEAHVLFALDMDMPAYEFGRIHHLAEAQIALDAGFLAESRPDELGDPSVGVVPGFSEEPCGGRDQPGPASRLTVVMVCPRGLATGRRARLARPQGSSTAREMHAE